MDEMESMFNGSNDEVESTTKRNSKESACSSDYASCITCICSSPHHEYDSQTSMASEGPEDNQDFQLEFVNCSTPASMADDYEDGDQTLEEECADSVSSVYDEPAQHLLRKSPRKSVILSGTYKISKGKPPFKSRQYKAKIGNNARLNTSCPSHHHLSPTALHGAVETDKPEEYDSGCSRSLSGESSVSSWNEPGIKTDRWLKPKFDALKANGGKEQRVPAVDLMIYKGKFPILRLDRIDRPFSKTDTFATAVPSEDKPQDDWFHQGNVEGNFFREEDEDGSLGDVSDRTVSSCRGTEYFTDFRSSQVVDDTGAADELESSLIVSEELDSVVRKVEREMKADFCKQLRQLLTKYEEDVDVPSQVEAPDQSQDEDEGLGDDNGRAA